MPIRPTPPALLPFAGVNSQAYGAKAPRAMFRSLAIASSGLSAQRMRLEVSAQNIANAETTRTAEGGPYQRRVVRVETAEGAQPLLPPEVQRQVAAGVDALGYGATMDPAVIGRDGTQWIQLPSVPTIGPDDEGGVRVAAVEQDASEGPLVYDPGHPDANQDGYVRMPNVSVTDELVEIMTARRIYEANATVFTAAKQMLRKAIDI
jgi:flagellar basal-body rod protein FlgC